MKHNWENYREKVLELKQIFKNKNEGTEVEVEVLLPEDEGYDSEVGVPYVRVRYYVNDHYHERKIELYEYHLKKELDDLVNLIEHFIQEFEMEIDQSEYGGG
ncbi:dephospho-CoA kinase [Hydrogenivirga caldilitoris]|uniref:Dephospho-CoA kinase n=1 Tax=Hydrogenivirga caldilitoris TaxID=246264 RepID=A0A497XP66_9AQUI|nr:dephospho-CoA kinase [Hydrogenivirga caldilitoris]RLJ70658.1 dephospho-CoA kinase [Hydrogenivirga caldilitoris]